MTQPTNTTPPTPGRPDDFEELLAAIPSLGDDAFAERALGCLLGGALGDAFGYLVEFDKLPRIRARFGPDGLTEFPDGRLIVSDDTQMTLFTLEGLLEAGLAAPVAAKVQAIRRAYLDWYATQRGSRPDGRPGLARHPELWVERAPGNTCLGALLAGGRGTVTQPVNDSKGCGGVMRAAPIGLIRADDPETCFRIAVDAAALTHGHPSGYLPAGAMAAMVRLIIDGTPLAEAANRTLAMLRAWPGHGETSAAISGALKRAAAPRPDRDIAALGEGWVGEEALAVGLYSALVGGDLMPTLVLAANHDGDSDSTASIAGQLYGAARGLSDIPERWCGRLDVAAPLAWLSRRLLAAQAGVITRAPTPATPASHS